ncbi:hypothetical protein [Pseudomonas beijingensis]|uniref:hypothetical protein n=1 Tax=Pseudomonas beijingensis TaxID=2954101 RepID=UPI00273644FB|nr:hypothetical protein [Pseudomonas sp. FP2262]WLH43955.1 hypothetical protein PSH83_16325 [Pseudomonas sp. FP2262]
METGNSMVGSVDEEMREIMRLLESAESTRELPRLLLGVGKDDLALIGELIQMYCVADALCRGLIAMLQERRLGTTSDSAYSLNDTDVLLHTKKEARETALNIDKAGIITAVETFEMHRIFRHTFSHWVVQRYSDGKHLVALSRSAPDAKKRDGIALEGGNAKLMVFRIDLLMTELAKIKGHCKFLSQLHACLEGAPAT